MLAWLVMNARGTLLRSTWKSLEDRIWQKLPASSQPRATVANQTRSRKLPNAQAPLSNNTGNHKEKTDVHRGHQTQLHTSVPVQTIRSRAAYVDSRGQAPVAQAARVLGADAFPSRSSHASRRGRSKYIFRILTQKRKSSIIRLK